MKHSFRILFCFVFACSALGIVRGQQIAHITPPNITLRGISLGDYSHAIAVGDSATIWITKQANLAGWFSRGRYFPMQAPCGKSHTFYGVSYYDTLHALIIADEGLIYKTSDAGEHWTQTGNGISSQTYRGVTHTANGSLIIVGDSGIILSSHDTGTTWVRIASGSTHNINAISINSQGKGYFVGEHGLIGKTTDFGATWVSVTDTIRNMGGNTDYINFRGVDISTDGDSAMAVGDSGGFAQTGFANTLSGSSWKAFQFIAVNSGLPSTHDSWMVQHACYTSVLYCNLNSTGVGWFILGNHDYLHFTTRTFGNVEERDGNNGDADGDIDLISDKVLCGAIWRAGPIETVLLAGTQGKIWGSIDSVNNWYSVNDSLTYAPFLNVSIDSFGKGFAITNGGLLLTTADNGFTWKIFAPAVFTIFTTNIIQPTDIIALDSNKALGVGWAGIFFRTTNGGSVWDTVRIDSNLNNLHSISNPAKDVYVVCGDYGTILRSVDDAKTWNLANLSTTAFLRAVAFSSTDIGIAAGDNGTILRTTDQGLSWHDIPNPQTGSTTSYRKLIAFPSGRFYATSDSSGLVTSTDNGQNWHRLPYAPQTMGMGFYNEQIGVIAEKGWCDSLTVVHDTARFAFTTDGFSSPPVEFNVPILNNGRMPIHFLDATSFLCYGLQGNIVKIDMTPSGVHVTNLSTQRSHIQAYPNPSATHSTTIEYDLANSGDLKIELLNELGERVETLFEGNQEIGHHTQQVKINPGLHGAFFARVVVGAGVRVVPLIVE